MCNQPWPDARQLGVGWTTGLRHPLVLPPAGLGMRRWVTIPAPVAFPSVAGPWRRRGVCTAESGSRSSLWAPSPSAVGSRTLFKKRVEGTLGCRVRGGCPDLALEAQDSWEGGSGGTQGPALLFLYGTVPCW